MKKVIISVLIVLLIIFSYFYIFNNKQKEIPLIDIEDELVEVSSYHIYSTYLNMSGSMELSDISFDDVKLVLYNGEFKEYEIDYDVNGTYLTFNLAKELNRGLYLDNIEDGINYLFIKVSFKNYENEEEKIIKYYALNNKTDYNDIKYYTMSKYNKEITINSDNNYKTMMLNVNDNKNTETVDFVIDPGHGGMDGGAESFGSCEKDFTYNISQAIGNKLIKSGYTVAYTRDDVSDDVLIEKYNKGGRAVIPSEKHAKYVLSIHLNSSSASYVKGLEIYSAIGINYDLANSIVKNITKESGLQTSPRKTYKLDDGIYGHNFTKDDISRSLETYEKKGYKPYNITTKSNYYYMIRETGGIVTGAYVSDLNEKVGHNPYYNSNVGAEAYILELGYITNKEDFALIESKHEQFATAINTAINETLLK